MVELIYYTLLAMVGIYFIWLLLSNLINKIFKFKICAICATVVTTWLGLLILKLIGFNISQLVIAILMGQSIAGFMYFLERRAESTKNKSLRLMKPLVILFGTLIVYWILAGVY